MQTTPACPITEPQSASARAVAVRVTPVPPAERQRRLALRVGVLTVLWLLLTDFRLDALAFGVPAILLGAALAFLLPATPGWRISPRGALAFALWFALQSVRGAVDVAARAMAPRMPLRPGFRNHPLTLPAGAPRVLFLNTITLLPGTLSVEVAGDEVIVHMLDTRADLTADLGALQARVAALFALA